MAAAVQSLDGRAYALAVPDSEIDIRALLRGLWRKRFWVLIPTLIAAGLAFATVQVITPKYRSEARVLFDGRENVFLRPEADKATIDRGTVDPEAVASQVQLVLSRDLAHEVIAKLKLAELPEFDILLRGVSLPRKILVMLGLAKDPLRMTPEERVLEAYYDRLNVYPVDKSRVIVIEFQSQNPELAARVANAIAGAYLGFQQATKQEQARSASQWLAGEIEKLRVKVKDAEEKVEQFRARSSLFLGNNNTPLPNQQLGDLAAQLAAARAQMADATARAQHIREVLRSGRPLESSDLLNSELIRRLTEQRVTLRAQLAEQSATLLDAHPRIKELKAQIADLERQIREEAERLARALENDAQVASSRVETLGATLEQLKRQAAASGGQDIELRALEREARAQRDLLESYLAKYREATARENIDAAPSDARVISRAVVSNTPAFPKKVPIVLVATLATLVLFSGFIATGQLMSTVPDRSTIAAAASAAPPAAPAPPALETATGSSEPPAPAAPPGPRAERGEVISSVSGRTLRDVGVFNDTSPALAVPVSSIEAVARSLRRAGEAGRRVTVVGALRNIGTTMAAITLARSLAKDSKVVLVDLALGAPNLSAISSEPDAPGIADVVRGTASVGQIITRDRLSSVHLIAAGRGAEDAAAILASQRLATTIEALARTYAHVVIDAGAVPEIAAERFAHLTARAVLVAGDVEDPATHMARDRLLGAGFSDVTVLIGAPRGPQSGERAAAVAS